MEFHRKYQCQDCAEDSLSVKPLDGETLRFVAESSDADNVVSAHLNRDQVSNLIELLRDWVATPPNKVDLWEDV